MLTREARWMAATLVAEDAVLSHRSAAALWRIWRGERGRIEITRPRWVRARKGLQIRVARLAHDKVTSHQGIPVTTPARTLLDLAAVVTAPQLERAATEAEIQRLRSALSLEALLERYPGRAGTPALRALLQSRAIGRNVTKHELVLRFLAFLDAHGLPRPHVNAKVELTPRARQVDCLWPDRRIVASSTRSPRTGHARPSRTTAPAIARCRWPATASSASRGATWSRKARSSRRRCAGS